MPQSIGDRVVLASSLQFMLLLLLYGLPFPFRVLEILYAVTALANMAALTCFSYQAFRQDRPILGLLAAAAAFPALLLTGVVLGLLISRR